ncbi:MAG: double-strand break repair helicase AddA [bacterium]
MKDAYHQATVTQRLVADPANSAWLIANAGSGKTKVLTDRVMRLLLTGASPSKILCITFTKAAAAEMSERLFDRLGAWSLMDDDTLKQKLYELDSQSNPSPDKLSQARKLFAQALEVPGGLKIQTIHSFCESVLRRFPVESGVSPGFTVIEDDENSSHLQQQLELFVGTINQRASEYKDAFNLLSEQFSAMALRDNLLHFCKLGHSIVKAVEHVGGWSEYKFLISSCLDLDPHEEEACFLSDFSQFIDHITPTIQTLIERMAQSNATGKKHAILLQEALNASTPEQRVAPLISYIFTTQGTRRKSLVSKKLSKELPEAMLSTLHELADRCEAVLDKQKAFRVYKITTAFHLLAYSIYGMFTEHNRKQGVLNFDDLIKLTTSLFRRVDTSWVMYKIDQGIDHILVDEAQDTNPDQWGVIDGIAEELYAGAGVRPDARSLFVVGDEKQSIYSFQGANVDLFNQKRQEIYEKITASGRAMAVEKLALSFRSTQAILSFVDTLYEIEGASQGVSHESAIKHFSYRQEEAGLVELWPLVMRSETPPENPWDMPVNQNPPGSPATILAKQIATTIAQWLEQGEILESQNRPIRPGDIKILCQKRSTFFHELIRELRRAQVPMAGSDRFKLVENIAVKDLCSALGFALQPNDNLSLAELLTSPLFGFDTDLLYFFAQGRGKTSLWQRLKSHHKELNDPSQQNRIANSIEDLARALTIGQQYGAFAFLTHLLEQPSTNENISGWQRFYNRLGLSCREAIQELLSEALIFEAQNPRSLQGFLAHLEQLQKDLKKEIDGTDDLVRIMTIHGSKGLEANIVFMADMGLQKNNSKSTSILVSAPDDTAIHLYQPEKKEAPTIIRDAQERAKAEEQEESRRVLYVAATRARDRLYLCGTRPGRGSEEDFLAKDIPQASWYTMAHKAFQRLHAKGQLQEVGFMPWSKTPILRFESGQRSTQKPLRAGASTEKDAPPPRWLFEKAPQEKNIDRINPSRLADLIENEDAPTHEEESLSPLEVVASDPDISARQRGIGLHLLLEKLPAVPSDQQTAVAEKLLRHTYPALSEQTRQAWIDEVLAVLGDDRFAPIFGPGSEAEVPISGRPAGLAKGQVFTGIIDRLLVTESQILIVDYKSNRPPPRRVEDISPAYLLQMASYRALLQELYPERDIQCALLWTWQARLMPLPNSLLDHTFKRVTASTSRDEI